MGLMLVGIGCFGALTANLASLLQKCDQTHGDAILELATEVRILRDEISLLRQEQAGSLTKRLSHITSLGYPDGRMFENSGKRIMYKCQTM